MKKVLILISVFFNTVAFANPATNGILKWETVIVKKDFILSNSLQYHRFCKKIWKKQVPAFKKENPHIRDVNKFYPGDEIKLQLCENKTYIPFSIKGEIVSQSDSYEIVEEQKTIVQNTTIKQESESETNFDSDYTQMSIGGGYLSEYNDDQSYTTAAATFRLNNSIDKNIEYKLGFDLAPSIVIVKNQLDFAFSNKELSHFYANAGLGSRVGLEDKTSISSEFTNQFNSYAYVGVGYKYRTQKVIADINIGGSINAKVSPYFSGMLLQRIRKTDYFIGGYFDSQSTSQSIKRSTDERRYSTGGLMVSF